MGNRFLSMALYGLLFITFIPGMSTAMNGNVTLILLIQTRAACKQVLCLDFYADNDALAVFFPETIKDGNMKDIFSKASTLGGDGSLVKIIFIFIHYNRINV